MKVGDLHRNREAHLYPTPETILAEETAKARRAYSQHGDRFCDATLLAFAAWTLGKNIKERTDERDRAYVLISQLRLRISELEATA